MVKRLPGSAPNSAWKPQVGSKSSWARSNVKNEHLPCQEFTNQCLCFKRSFLLPKRILTEPLELVLEASLDFEGNARVLCSLPCGPTVLSSFCEYWSHPTALWLGEVISLPFCRTFIRAQKLSLSLSVANHSWDIARVQLYVMNSWLQHWRIKS